MSPSQMSCWPWQARALSSVSTCAWSRAAQRKAEVEGVDLRLYNVIYNVVEDIQKALTGMLEPVYRDVLEGRAEVRQVFKVGRTEAIAGSFVLDGKITRSAIAHVLRGGKQVYEGKIAGLRRFKDDVREVATGFECGISLEGFAAFEVGDLVEAHGKERVSSAHPPKPTMRGEPSRRVERLNELLRDEISDLIRRELKDPRIAGLVTVTQVETASDLSSARVFISVLGSEEDQKASLAVLRRAAGFFRHQLLPRLSLRRVPELEFRPDRSIEHGDHILSLLRQIDAVQQSQPPAAEGEPGPSPTGDQEEG